MKRAFILGFILLFSGVAFSQTKTASKLGKAAKYSHNDSVMCNTKWVLTMVEEEGAASKPAEKNQNDMLFMGLDGKFYLVLNGIKKAGTWARAGQNINFTDVSEEKFSYKVLSIDPKKLKVEYRNNDEMPVKFEMEPK